MTVLTMVLAGCGGGDEAAPAVVSTTSTTSAPLVSTATTTVAESTTPVASTTTGPETSTTIAEAGVPVLTFSDPPTESELFALADAYWAAVERAGLDPGADQTHLASVLTEPLFSRALASMANFADLGQVLLPPTGGRQHRLLFIEADEALVESCYLDDGIIQERSGAIVNDAVETAVRQLEMAPFQGRWLVREQYLRVAIEGVQPCDSL